MSVPGFSITELARAAQKLKEICNAFFDEFENAPARIAELVETCNYLSTVLEEFGALLGDSYPQETTFKRKLDECYAFITKYSALNRRHLSEVAQEDRIAGKFRDTSTHVWQTTRFSFDDKRAQTLKDGLSLEIQKFLTFILLFALRRTIPVGDASSSTLNSQRPTVARARVQESLERPSRFALAATGQTSTNFMIEDVGEGDTVEICFRRLLRLRSLYERETSMAAVNGQPENIEPLQNMLESIWHTLCVRAGVARLNGPTPPLPREPLRLLEAPARNYNDLLIDMTPSSTRVRSDSHSSLFSPTMPVSLPAVHRRPIPVSPPPAHRTSRSSSYFNSVEIGRDSTFNSPRLGRNSMSSPSTNFTTDSSPYHAGSVSSFGATPFALPLPAMPSQVAVATITLLQEGRKSTLQQWTVHLQEWRCRPELGRAELVEWTGQDPSQIFHHHIPTDAIPQTFHASQKLRKLDLIFQYGHSHHIMLFENDQIVHEQQMPVEYVFTSTEARDAFQGDLLGKLHVASFDMNVVWSDSVHETNAMGNIEGMAILEKFHIWKDKKWPHRHTVSFLASKTSGALEEYPISRFKEAERSHGTVTLKQRKERENRDSSGSIASGRRRSSVLRRFSGMGSIPDEAIASSPVSPLSPFGSTTTAMEQSGPKWLSIKFTGKSAEAKLFVQTFNAALEQDGVPADIPYPSVPELADTPAPVELPADRWPSELGGMERAELDGIPYRLH